MIKITAEQIRSIDPCYDPSEVGFTDDMSLTPIEIIDQGIDKVKHRSDIICLLCRKEYMSDRDMQAFGIWCAKETNKLDFTRYGPEFSIIHKAQNAAKKAVRFAQRNNCIRAAGWASLCAAWLAMDKGEDALLTEAAAITAQLQHLKTYFL